MLPPNLYARVRISTTPCTRDRGCGAHPVFPAPSQFLEGKRNANLGQNLPRDREGASARDRAGTCRKSREPAPVDAAANRGWVGPPSWEEKAVGYRLALADRTGQHKRIRRAKTLRAPRFILHAGLIRRSEFAGWEKER